MAFELTGKKAFVAGGGDALGKAMAVALAEAGADVAVGTVVPSQADAVKDAAQAVAATGRKTHDIAMDVSNSSDCDAAIGEVQRELGGLDILVNNVDVVFGKATSQTSDREWSRTIELNLTGVFNLCRAGGTAMIDRGAGRIINICSVNGERGMANSAAYCSAKAGVINLTRALASEWGRTGVRVCGLGVGFLEGTPYADDANLRNQLERYLPMRRFGDPEEIAPSIVYAASQEADFLVGQIFYLEGGVLSHI